MALFSAGSSLAYHLAPFALNVITILNPLTFNGSLLGWLLISLGYLLTPLRLNSCSSDSKPVLHLTPTTLLEILALYVTNIFPSLTKWHLSPKIVTITYVRFAVSGFTSIRQLPVPLLHLSFTPNLITIILSTINTIQPSSFTCGTLKQNWNNKVSP